MPLRPKPPCPACGRLGGCGCRAARRQAADAVRGTPAQRGYGGAHRIERARLAVLVAQGGVSCARCGEPIGTNEPWDLGHTDDRTSWTGAEHASCNRADGARKRNALYGLQPGPGRPKGIIGRNHATIDPIAILVGLAGGRCAMCGRVGYRTVFALAMHALYFHGIRPATLRSMLGVGPWLKLRQPPLLTADEVAWRRGASGRATRGRRRRPVFYGPPRPPGRPRRAQAAAPNSSPNGFRGAALYRDFRGVFTPSGFGSVC